MLRALALGAGPRTRAWVFALLADPALREGGSLRPTQEAVRQAIAGLAAAGWLVEDERRPGRWALPPGREAGVYAHLLAHAPLAQLRVALGLAEGESVLEVGRYGQARWSSVEVAVARLRLEALGGGDLDRLAQFASRLPWGVDSVDTVLEHALDPCLDAGLFARLHPSVQAQELQRALKLQTEAWQPPSWPVIDLARAWLEEEARADGGHAALRWALAEALLLCGDAQSLAAVLAPLEGQGTVADAARAAAMALAFRAAQASLQGDWAVAEAAGDEALAALRKLSGRRKQLLPENLALLHALGLMAQDRPAAWRKALAFCLAEGGRREPMLDSPAGCLALALQIRLGEAPRELRPFAPYHDPAGRHVSRLDLWRWMMRAWLASGEPSVDLKPEEAVCSARLRMALQHAGLRAWTALLDGALQVLAGEPAEVAFFAGPSTEPWQVTLAALQAVAEPEGKAEGLGRAPGETRLLWALALDDEGRIEGLVPHEQTLGARGWSRPKPVPLSRLHQARARLHPPDAALAQALQPEPQGRGWRLDLAQALGALPGHPGLVLAEDLHTPLQLAESGPTLDVVDEGAHLRVRMHPNPLGGYDLSASVWASAAELKAREALRGVRVLRDAPGQARLVRLTPAQLRVAQLLGPEGLQVPRRGVEQLQQVLQGLGAQFRIQADEEGHAAAERDLPAESRLRAELQPVGDGLQLRLVAAPYGQAHAADGPRFVPGQGRAHLVTVLGGERLGVRRDLALERRHAEDLIDACPMLDPRGPQAPCEWQIPAPDDALTLVEVLHRHHAVAALDWPQGRAIRVDAAGLQQLTLKVQTRQDWLALQGGVTLDEGLVLSLQQLLGLAAASRSRFIPLGEGRVLALTQELRERIDDLAAVAEQQARRGGLAELRVPAVAAPWLQQVLQDSGSEVDEAFVQRLQQLEAAQRLLPRLPSALQAELRPYQEEGYEWAMRLAEAGLGAVLADDMGLGKTLQALAVLVARAGQGPALVVAPTSLIGNWLAEARRFAPTLRVRDHAGAGASDRAARLDEVGPQDVVLVSYGLLQIDGEAFAARPWATLVLDEAQAIKNAAAKRSQAVFALQAGFRLALSGTPVENRLAELWSIMRACNPGLLGSAARFHERFGAPIERQQDRHAQRTLRRLVAPFILRRTKAQVLQELPPRTELVLKVRGDPREQAHYEALRRDTLQAAERALSGDAPGQAQLNILAGLTRLRRAACDPRLVSPTLKSPGAKVQAFAALADELVANGHKALVFSQFVDFLGLLREALETAGHAHQWLDGSTPAAERTRRVEAFQRGEGHFFLISLKAGGFGLNLTVADYVVIADPWWNPAAEDQASGRAHRIGQQRPVTVYRLVHEGTLEERILSLHVHKRDLADRVLEEGGDPRQLPRADELLALMRADAEPDGPSG